MENLCGSVGASLLFVYLTFLAAYLLGPTQADVVRAVPMSLSAASLVLIVLARRDILALFHSARVRQTVAGFSLLLIWTVVHHFPGTDGMHEMEVSGIFGRPFLC
jgi:histidine ammonia-lyase